VVISRDGNGGTGSEEEMEEEEEEECVRVATETQRNIEKALRYSVLLRFRYKRHEKILNSFCCVDSKTLF